MSELPGLPPRPQRTRPLPPGGLEAAIEGGRRRRNRAIAAVAGTAAAVVLAVPVVTSLPGSGSDRLVPAGPASGAPSTSPSPSAAAPLNPAAFQEQTDVDADGGGDCAPASAGGDALCRYTEGTAPGSTLRPGDTATVVLGYCLPRDAPADHVFRFATGQEKDVVVTGPDGAEAFRFSATVRYVDGPHERRVRRGRCVEWSGEWDLVTTGGQPVPPGPYVVRMTVRAASETDPARLPETVEVPVTVTG